MENKEDEFKIPEIKSSKDLDKIFDALYDQGFGYVQNQDSFHKAKIDKIIHKNNKLKIDIPSSFYYDTYKIKNYSEAEASVINHVSKFNPSDKINELIKNKFPLKYDDRCEIPEYNETKVNKVIDWFNFKAKYRLNDKDLKKYVQTKNYLKVDIYDLDKKFIKISFGNDISDFETLYELIFNEKCSGLKNSSGDWQNIGKIEIKQFLNGTANIRGDIDKFKEYYYNKLINDVFYNNVYVVSYNKTTKLIEPIEYKR